MSINIIEMRDISDFLKLIPMEMEIRNKGRDIMPIKDMITFVQRQLEDNPNFHILIAYDDERIVGYAAFYINPQPEFRQFHLYRIWTDPKRPDALKELDETRKQIMKHLKLKSFTIEVYKNVHALERKGFYVKSYIMEQRT